MSTETTKLTARQRARKALQRDQDKQKRREQALASVLTSLDERDAISARIGSALGDLIDLGDTKTSAGELAGLTVRDVTEFLRAARDANTTDEDDSSDDEQDPGANTTDTDTDTDTDEVVSASAGEHSSA
ncbi:MAG: hypothetical protein L0H20_11875 [Corynebacterium sp.]|uniref:hypothetical protein n=1 Tax=Corynebacterium sp. TaxID=1720 RepID=UPI002648C8A1|nr:hypothetical protein [Corynebacterium sp.]MDN5723675.1 hypothetical protein [Corynebacterium sp.]